MSFLSFHSYYFQEPWGVAYANNRQIHLVFLDNIAIAYFHKRFLIFFFVTAKGKVPEALNKGLMILLMILACVV